MLIDVTVAKKRIKGIVLINFRIQIGKKWNYVFILYMPSLGVKELRPADIIAEGGATLCSDSQWESGQRAFAEFYPRYMKAKYRKIIGIVNKPPKSPISTHSPFTSPSPVFFAESPQQDSPDGRSLAFSSMYVYVCVYLCVCMCVCVWLQGCL